VSGEYQNAYQESITNPERFWGQAARAIKWHKEPGKILDESRKPFYTWFSDGELNTCYNAVDFHVENGKGSQPAFIYDSPVTNSVRNITFSELQDLVSRFAGVLKANGVGKGDRVVIYMPMIPEAAVAMLACARIGAIHSVVFGGFAPYELSLRIDDAAPRIVVTASCGIEGKKIIEYKPMLEKAIELAANKPEKRIIYQRPQLTAQLGEHDLDWAEEMNKARPVDCVPLKSTDPLYILYTSGTTGKPKGVVRDNGGHAVALKWTMKNVYGVEPGEVFWAASDVGWVVGHSYIIYAPLLYGCTSVIYEGKPVGTPDAGAFWRVVSQHKVRVFFTAPTAVRAIKREDAKGNLLRKYDISCLKYLFLAGERLDPDTYLWAKELLGIPVIDHWWQTETGWAITGNCMGLGAVPFRVGSAGKPMPGYGLQVLDEADGKVVPPGTDGVIAIRLPLPPGSLLSLWQDDDKYVESYLETYPGYYYTGDVGRIDKDGYVFAMGRADDVIKVAGHRLSTGAMEEVIARHPDVAECAVVGVADSFRGQVPLGFVVLKQGVTRSNEEIVKDLVQMVRDNIGAVAVFKNALIVSRLPKTRSGKVIRSVMRKISDGKPYTVPATIEDASVLDEIKDSVKAIQTVA
jgi:propionyl-CoA synthetase